MKQQYIFPIDTCVICGMAIPEGRQICPECEHQIIPYTSTSVHLPAIPAPGLLCRLRLFFQKLQTKRTSEPKPIQPHSMDMR